MNASPITLNDLEAISTKEAVTRNAILSAVGGRIYQIAGQQLIFGLSTSAGDDVLKLALQFNGQNIVLGLSNGFVNALLQSEGVGLSDVNLDVLNLLVRIKVIPKLPQGIQFKGLALANSNNFEQALQSLPLQVSLRGATQAGELLGWDIAIYALPQTSLSIFLKSFDFLVSQVMPSPLLKAKVQMPIVAAKTSIAANQLLDIAIGDVILFG
jgi:hypothetical protein